MYRTEAGIYTVNEYVRKLLILQYFQYQVGQEKSTCHFHKLLILIVTMKISIKINNSDTNGKIELKPPERVDFETDLEFVFWSIFHRDIKV